MLEQDRIIRFADLPFPDSDDEGAFEEYMPVYQEFHRQLMSRQLDQVWEKVYNRPGFRYPDDFMESRVGDCLEKLDAVILAAFMYGADWALNLDRELWQGMKEEKAEAETEGTKDV